MENILRPDLIWPAVLEMIAGGASLTEALRRLPDPPSYAWARKQLRDYPALRDAYEDACQDRADRLAEEIIELADERWPADLEPASRGAWVNHRRLQVDVRKWAAAKLYPRKYAERMDVSVSSTSISITAALAEAERRVLIGLADDQRLSVGPNVGPSEQ
jgi:hypothetical protein